MKKLLAILALVATGSAFAGGWVSVDVDHVSGQQGAKNSVAQYVRAGTELAGLNMGLQSRTGRNVDGSATFNSLEVTAGKAMGLVTPFVGVGRDNGAGSYNYGLVGVTAGQQVGPGFALIGVKTRVRESVADPKQTITFATYSVPVAKNVAVK